MSREKARLILVFNGGTFASAHVPFPLIIETGVQLRLQGRTQAVLGESSPLNLWTFLYAEDGGPLCISRSLLPRPKSVSVSLLL